MKVEFTEYDHAITISLTPETVEDAVQLARLAINSNKQIHHIAVYANKDGTMDANVSLKKNRNVSNKLGRGKGW